MSSEVFFIAPIMIFKVDLSVSGMILLLDLMILLYMIAQGWFGEKRWQLFGIVCGVSAVLAVLILFVLMPNAGPNLKQHLNYKRSFQYIVISDILRNTPFVGGADMAARSSNAVSWLQGFTNDANFILVKLAGMLGTWVYVAVILLNAIVLVGAMRLCLREKTMLCRVMSLSIIGVVAIQCFGYILLNVGICFNVLPMPFISYGNTSLILNMVLMGMLFCILAKGWMYSDETPLTEEKGKLKMS